MSRKVEQEVSYCLVGHSMIGREEDLPIHHILGSPIFPLEYKFTNLLQRTWFDGRIGIAVGLTGPDGLFIELDTLG